MKIFVYDNSGHPFQVELSRNLAKRGYEVLHGFSESFQTPKGDLIKTEADPDSFNIIGIKLEEEFKKNSYIKRRKQEIQIGQFVSEQIERMEPDIFIASNVPIDTLKIIQNKCKKMNCKFIFWVQDLYGPAIGKILSKKIGFLGKLVGNFYNKIEQNILSSSDAIILISEDFASYVNKKEKVYVIPNWATINKIQMFDKDNSFSRKHNIVKCFNYVYSGTLGHKHNPELLIKLALSFNKSENMKIIVITEGIGRNYLEKRKTELNLNNIILLDFINYREMSMMLSSADVLIALLEEDAGIFSVPSKVLTYLCAGKIILASMPSENLASKILSKHSAGLVSLPNQEEKFVENAKKIFNDKDIRISFGKNGRNYAEKNFDIDNITDKFIEIFNHL